MTLTSTDLRYLRTALRTEGRTLLRIDPCTFRVAVSRWPRHEVQARIHDHITGEFVWSGMGQPERIFDAAVAAIEAHRYNTDFYARVRAAEGAA